MCLTYRMEKQMIIKNHIELMEWFANVVKQLIAVKHTSEMFRALIAQG